MRCTKIPQGRLGLWVTSLVLSTFYAHGLTTIEHAAITADVTAKLPTLINLPADGNPERARKSRMGDAIGGLVRLSFHDAATYDQREGNGGPDGCLLWEDKDNAGLLELAGYLDPIYETHKGRVSKADFWAIAANAALLAAMPKDERVDIPFRWGRKDASQCAYDEGRLPDAEQGLNHTKVWAMQQMGMTERETVALMGAHTLGRAQQSNSGYDGPWVDNDATLDNKFYKGLVKDEWSRLTMPGPITQWSRMPGLIMLNTDMALAFDLDDRPKRCGGNAADAFCRPAPTRPIVDEYIESNSLWIEDFVAAWTKLQELGLTDLTDLIPPPPPPPRTPKVITNPVESPITNDTDKTSKSDGSSLPLSLLFNVIAFAFLAALPNAM